MAHFYSAVDKQGDDWFVTVWNRHRTGLIVEDHGDISDADFRTLLDHHSAIPIELHDDNLFQAIVLRCGRRGDVLFVRCHHGVADGHSMIVLTDDWLNLLIGIPLRGQGVTHAEYLAELSRLSDRQVIENRKYWKQLLLPALPNPGLGEFGASGEHPRIVYRTDTNRSITRSLASAEFKQIPRAVNARSQTPFSIVQAAFADALLELSGLPGIYVETVVDRRSRKLRNFVGCAVDFPPIRCDAANGISLAEYSSKLASQFKQSLAHLPSEAAALELDFDLEVHQSGGLLRHFSYELSFPTTRAKISPFSSGTRVALETPKILGPLSITHLELAARDHNFDGLRLRITPFANQTKFEFSYQSNFYIAQDIETLCSVMQKKLHTRFV